VEDLSVRPADHGPGTEVRMSWPTAAGRNGSAGRGSSSARGPSPARGWRGAPGPLERARRHLRRARDTRPEAGATQITVRGVSRRTPDS